MLMASVSTSAGGGFVELNRLPFWKLKMRSSGMDQRQNACVE